MSDALTQVREMLAIRFGDGRLPVFREPECPFRRAAVLVPILNRPDGLTLLFVRRGQHVRHHRGEIAFPGGRQEEGEDPIATALRETCEETGLCGSEVEVVGCFEQFLTITSYLVTPVIGVVRNPPSSFFPQAGEIEEVFEVPLADFLEGRIVAWQEFAPWTRFAETAPVEAMRKHRAGKGDSPMLDEGVPIHFFQAGPHLIWGVTGEMVSVLLTSLQKKENPAVW